MKIDLTVILKSLDGEVLEEKTKDKLVPITLKSVCVNAMLSMTDEDRQEQGTSKAERYKLAFKLSEGGNQDLSTDEIVKIKERIGKIYIPLIVGRAYDLLEGKTPKVKE
jgi:hypothetical protein